MRIGEVHAILVFILLAKTVEGIPYSSKFQIIHPYPDSFSAAQHRHGAHLLPKVLIGDNGRVYACSEKIFFAFERNGTIAWSLALNYTCSNIAPVAGVSGQILLVVDSAVLKIDPSKIKNPESAVSVFYNPEPKADGAGEIIGIAVSISSSCVLINVKKRGLYAYKLEGQLMWSAGPTCYQHDYRQGCRKNVTGYYFSSVPVIDHCEASIYISNNEGELYSLSIPNNHFRWIQDLSSFGKVYRISSGNNGMLYVTIPAQTLVLAIDAYRGNVLWQGTIGPLSSADYEPVVNIDGWISIGSLDGFLYSFSPKGVLKKFPKVPQADAVIQANPFLDCSGYAVYISHTIMEGKSSLNIGEYTYVSAMKPKNVLFKMLNPASGTVYWSESYPGLVSSNLHASDLPRFLMDEGTLLAFIVASRYGIPFPCRSTYHKFASSCAKIKPKDINAYTGNEKSIMMFLLVESMILILLAATVRFCCIFWKKENLQNLELGKFLEKRRSLQLQKKELDRRITMLKQKTTDEPVANEVLKTLSNMVTEREGILRELSTSYSFGRDESGSSKSRSLLPIHATQLMSYSFQGDPSDESTNKEKTDKDLKVQEEFPTDRKFKAPMEVYSSSDDDFHDAEHSTTDDESIEIEEWATPVGAGLSSRLQLNPLFIEHPLDQLKERKMAEGGKENIQSGSRSLRRRASSLIS